MGYLRLTHHPNCERGDHLNTNAQQPQRRRRVTYDDVAQACDAAVASGEPVPTVAQLIADVGGSTTTVSRYRRQWHNRRIQTEQRPVSSPILTAVQQLHEHLQHEVDERWIALKAESEALIASANERADAAESRVKDLESRFSDLQQRAASLEAAIADLRAQIAQKDEKLATASAVHAALQERFDAREREIAQREAAHAAELKRIADGRRLDLEALKRQYDELIAHARADNAALQRQLDEKNLALATTNALFGEQAKALAGAERALKDHVSRAERTDREQAGKIQRLEEALATATAHVAEQRESLARDAAELHHRNATIETLSKELRQLRRYRAMLARRKQPCSRA